MTTYVNPGLDASGNGNNWTTNNINWTSSGVTFDTMTDVPTLTSATASNYCVLNSLNIATDCTLSQANLTVAYGTATTRGPMQGTIGMATGKWYFEAVCTASSVSPTSNLFVGIANKTMPSELGNYTGANASGWGFNSNGGTVYNNGSSTAYGGSASVNDIVGVAFDADTGKLYFSINGTWQNSGNPATSTNPAFTGLSADTYYPSIGDGSGASTLTASINFGQRPFAYTPPTGYVALNTYNLPTPTIGATASSQANKYFDATLYTGNGSTQTITNSGSMQPDLVWMKARSTSGQHALVTSTIGVGTQLSTNNTVGDQTATDGITSLNSNGFSLGAGSIGYSTNNNGTTYVGWQWKANGGTGVTNTNGSITSTVSANTTSGFSVVTYTGNGTNGASYGHGLGVTPAMVITKPRSTTGDWAVWHTSLGAGYYLQLNTTAAKDFATGYLTPSSTVNTFTTSYNSFNGNGTTFVAYCFAEVAGFSKFGSYTGNGSTDGPFIYTGFRPRYIVTKLVSGGSTSGVGNWRVRDTARDPYNVSQNILYPNLSDAEVVDNQVDILSNGFKLRNALAQENPSGGTVIYMAFAESPFKYANAR